MTKKQLLARLAKMQDVVSKIKKHDDEVWIAQKQEQHARRLRDMARREFASLLRKYGMRQDYTHDGAVMVCKAAVYDAMQKEAKP